MKLSEHFYLLKRRIFKKNNIIFILVMVILLLAMFTSLTVMSLYITNELSALNKDISSREIYVYPPLKQNIFTTYDLEKIQNIEHVTFVGGKIFSGGVELNIDELNKPFSEALIFASPLLDGIELKMVRGKKEINSGEIICPENFYPYEVYSFDEIKDSEETDEIFEMKKKIIKSAKIKGHDLIGKTLNTKNLISYDYDAKLGKKYTEQYAFQDFKVVGTYDQSYTMSSLNQCYITKDDFFRLASIQADFKELEFKSLEQEINKEYSGVMILIDDYKNIGFIHQELDKLNFVYEDLREVDKADKLFFTYAPIFITLIIILVTINIIYNFNSKKIKQRVSNYALLKSLGYDNKTIEINEILENVICYLISFVISLIIFITCFKIFKINFMAWYIAIGSLINIPILPIVSIFIIVLCLLIIINNKLVAKRLKYSVLELMRKEI